MLGIYRVKVDWQGFDYFSQGVFFDLIPLGISIFSSKREWTLYIYFLLITITVMGDRDIK